jgi:hypothetical protein
MNDEQKKIILEMVGISGLEELEAIARLVSGGDSHTTYSDPYHVAIRLLSQGLENAKDAIAQGIGLGQWDNVLENVEGKQ